MYRRLQASHVPTAKGFDGVKLKPYHVCSDGILRTDEMERAWRAAGGVDELYRLRAHSSASALWGWAQG